MKCSALVAGVLLVFSAMAHADILNCTLNQLEISDPISMTSKLQPIRNNTGKEMTHSLIIAGLDTDHVSVKGETFSTIIETQYWPLNNGEGFSTDSEWYYFRSILGVAIIEITGRKQKKPRVRFTQLGQMEATASNRLTDYTYIGTCK